MCVCVDVCVCVCVVCVCVGGGGGGVSGASAALQRFPTIYFLMRYFDEWALRSRIYISRPTLKILYTIS